MFATTAAAAATSSRPMNAGSVASRNAVAPSNTNRALRCNHHQSRSNVKTRNFVVSVQAEAQKTIDMNEVSIIIFVFFDRNDKKNLWSLLSFAAQIGCSVSASSSSALSFRTIAGSSKATMMMVERCRYFG